MGRKDARAKRPASDRRKIIPITAIIQKYIGTMKLSKRSRGREGLTKRHNENHHDMLSIKLLEGCNNLLPWSSRPGHPENPSGGLPLFMARGRGSCPVHLPCIQSLNGIISVRGVLRFLALLSPLAVCPSSPSESLLERPGVVAVSSCPSLVRPWLSCSHLGCCQLSIVCRPDACVCWY